MELRSCSPSWPGLRRGVQQAQSTAGGRAARVCRGAAARPPEQSHNQSCRCPPPASRGAERAERTFPRRPGILSDQMHGRPRADQQRGSAPPSPASAGPVCEGQRGQLWKVKS